MYSSDEFSDDDTRAARYAISPLATTSVKPPAPVIFKGRIRRATIGKYASSKPLHVETFKTAIENRTADDTVISTDSEAQSEKNTKQELPVKVKRLGRAVPKSRGTKKSLSQPEFFANVEKKKQGDPYEDSQVESDESDNVQKRISTSETNFPIRRPPRQRIVRPNDNRNESDNVQKRMSTSDTILATRPRRQRIVRPNDNRIAPERRLNAFKIEDPRRNTRSAQDESVSSGSPTTPSFHHSKTSSTFPTISPRRGLRDKSNAQDSFLPRKLFEDGKENVETEEPVQSSPVFRSSQRMSLSSSSRHQTEVQNNVANSEDVDKPNDSSQRKSGYDLRSPSNSQALDKSKTGSSQRKSDYNLRSPLIRQGRDKSSENNNEHSELQNRSLSRRKSLRLSTENSPKSRKRSVQDLEDNTQILESSPLKRAKERMSQENALDLRKTNTSLNKSFHMSIRKSPRKTVASPSLGVSKRKSVASPRLPLSSKSVDDETLSHKDDGEQEQPFDYRKRKSRSSVDSALAPHRQSLRTPRKTVPTPEKTRIVDTNSPVRRSRTSTSSTKLVSANDEIDEKLDLFDLPTRRSKSLTKSPRKSLRQSKSDLNTVENVEENPEILDSPTKRSKSITKSPRKSLSQPQSTKSDVNTVENVEEDLETLDLPTRKSRSFTKSPGKSLRQSQSTKSNVNTVDNVDDKLEILDLPTRRSKSITKSPRKLSRQSQSKSDKNIVDNVDGEQEILDLPSRKSRSVTKSLKSTRQSQSTTSNKSTVENVDEELETLDLPTRKSRSFIKSTGKLLRQSQSMIRDRITVEEQILLGSAAQKSLTFTESSNKLPNRSLVNTTPEKRITAKGDSNSTNKMTVSKNKSILDNLSDFEEDENENLRNKLNIENSPSMAKQLSDKRLSSKNSPSKLRSHTQIGSPPIEFLSPISRMRRENNAERSPLLVISKLRNSLIKKTTRDLTPVKSSRANITSSPNENLFSSGFKSGILEIDAQSNVTESSDSRSIDFQPGTGTVLQYYRSSSPPSSIESNDSLPYLDDVLNASKNSSVINLSPSFINKNKTAVKNNSASKRLSVTPSRGSKKLRQSEHDSFTNTSGKTTQKVRESKNDSLMKTPTRRSAQKHRESENDSLTKTPTRRSAQKLRESKNDSLTKTPTRNSIKRLHDAQQPSSLTKSQTRSIPRPSEEATASKSRLKTPPRSTPSKSFNRSEKLSLQQETKGKKQSTLYDFLNFDGEIDSRKRKANRFVEEEPKPKKANLSTTTKSVKKPENKKLSRNKQSKKFAFTPKVVKMNAEMFLRTRLKKDVVDALHESGENFMKDCYRDLDEMFKDEPAISGNDIIKYGISIGLFEDKKEFIEFIREFVPLNIREKIIPCAFAGNVVYP